MRAPTRTTLAEAAAEWLSAAQAGVVRTRSGEAYKPSALRSYGSSRVARAIEYGSRACSLDDQRLPRLEVGEVRGAVASGFLTGTRGEESSASKAGSCRRRAIVERPEALSRAATGYFDPH